MNGVVMVCEDDLLEMIKTMRGGDTISGEDSMYIWW